MLSEERIEKFWKKVAVKSPDECWEWQGAKGSKGYGSFGIGKGKTALAHRIAIEVTTGEKIPEGYCVMHLCDNRVCCNPRHLVIGTPEQNVRDMVNKGRQARGEKNGKSKLKNEEVMEIRWIDASMYDKKGLVKELAKQYFVSESTIKKILHNETWNFPLAE